MKPLLLSMRSRRLCTININGVLLVHCCSVALLMWLLGQALPANAQQDALQSPAIFSAQAATSMLLDIEQAGNRYIAVGERGHILYSDDAGQSWIQAQVPVRETLTAVSFPTADTGWAVGHSGVILVSHDAGQTWQKQLDGNDVNQRVVEALVQHLANLQQSAEPSAQALDDTQLLLEDAHSFLAEGPTRAFLDVWFKDDQEGWVLGSFGLLMHTDDGGTNWGFIGHHLPNRDAFHYFSIQPVDEALLVSGEAGTLYRSMDGGRNWEQLYSPYEGSLFGLVVSDTNVVVLGLGGKAFISRDLGDSWEPLSLGINSSLNSGSFLADGSLVVVGNGGTLVQVSEDALPIQHKLPRNGAFTALVPVSQQRLLVVGDDGVQNFLFGRDAQ